MKYQIQGIICVMIGILRKHEWHIQILEAYNMHGQVLVCTESTKPGVHVTMVSVEHPSVLPQHLSLLVDAAVPPHLYCEVQCTCVSQLELYIPS